MTKIAILQSNYIPWKGYFHIIQKADQFVFLDTAQYTQRDWRNRNKIKSPDGDLWLTVPTNGTQSTRICDVKIDNCNKWYQDHFKTIRSNYKKCKYFDFYYNFIENLYLKREWENLWELNQFLIKGISRMLDITTKFHNSFDFELIEGKNEKIISIIKQLGGDHYITGPAAKNYIDPELFEKNEIYLEYMNYTEYPKYDQPWGKFNHQVSILDLLFCTGLNASKFIWEN